MPYHKRLRIHPEIRHRAVELRQPLTPTESRMWAVLRQRRLGGYKFRRQHPIGPYIVDFYCAEAGLIVEIDGDSHAQQIEYDTVRTAWLESLGYRLIRFTNQDVNMRLGQVTEELITACKDETHG